MNKSHAIIFLTRLLGSADGKWSDKEMEHALNLGNLSSALKEAPDWTDKILSGELNEDSAIQILNGLGKSEQMECLVTCLITILADGVADDAEITVLARLLTKLNQGITSSELLASHKEHLENLRRKLNL